MSSIPDKIRNEYDTVKSAYEEVSGTVREELDGVKKESKYVIVINLVRITKINIKILSKKK